MEIQEFNEMGHPPKNWLVESILVTLFCCLPFGIAGIIYASQVETKFYAGDYEGVLIASKAAGKWTKIGFFSMVILVGLYIFIHVVLFVLFGLSFLGILSGAAMQ